MHCGCMPWCLLNIKALGCGTELLLGELKEILLFFPILGLEFLFISYFLAAVIPIFLVSFVTWHPVSAKTVIHYFPLKTPSLWISLPNWTQFLKKNFKVSTWAIDGVLPRKTMSELPLLLFQNKSSCKTFHMKWMWFAWVRHNFI